MRKIIVLYILIFMFLGRTKNSELDGSMHCLHLICSYFLHECDTNLSVISNYLKFAIFSEDILAICMI